MFEKIKKAFREGGESGLLKSKILSALKSDKVIEKYGRNAKASDLSAHDLNNLINEASREKFEIDKILNSATTRSSVGRLGVAGKFTKSEAEEHFKKTKSLNAKGYVNTKAPTVLDLDADDENRYISIKLNPNYKRPLDIDKKTAFFPDRVPSEIRPRSVVEEKDILEKFRKEFAPVYEDVGRDLSVLRSRRFQPRDLQPSEYYHSAFDYLLDNPVKSLPQGSNNTNPLIKKLKESGASDKIPTENLNDEDNRRGVGKIKIPLSNDKKNLQEVRSIEEVYQAIRDRNLRDHANFENVVGAVGNRMQVMDDHVQSLVRQNDALGQHIEDVRTDTIQRLRAHSRENERLVRTIEDLEREKASLASEIKTLSKDSQVSKAHSNELSSTIEHLSEQLRDKDSEVSQAQKDLQDFHQRFTSLEAKLQDRESNYEHDLSKLKSNLNALTELNSRLKKDIEKGNLETERNYQENESVIKALKNELEKQNQRYASLKSDFLKSDEEYRSAILSLEDKLINSKRDEHTLKNQLDQLRYTYENQKGVNVNTESLKRLEEEITFLYQELKNKQGEIQLLGKELIDTQSLLKQIENKELMNADAVNRELEDIKFTKIALENQVADIEEKLAYLHKYEERKPLEEVESILQKNEQPKFENIEDQVKSEEEETVSKQEAIEKEEKLKQANQQDRAVAVEEEIAKVEQLLEDKKEELENVEHRNAHVQLQAQTKIIPVDPPKFSNREIQAYAEGISDPDWRNFFITLLTNTEFLQLLERFEVELSGSSLNIVYKNVVIADKGNVLEFIKTMSDKNKQRIKHIAKFEGTLEEFTARYIPQYYDSNDDVSYNPYFKYVVALYNSFFGESLQFRHSELIEEEFIFERLSENDENKFLKTLALMISNYENDYTLNQNLKIANTLVLNAITTLNAYNELLVKSFVYIFNTHIKTLSDRTIKIHFVNTLLRGSSIFKENTKHNAKFGNYVEQLRNLSPTLFLAMLIDCTATIGICPPSLEHLNLETSYTNLDIVDLYTSTNKLSYAAKLLGSINMMLYLLGGVLTDVNRTATANIIRDVLMEFLDVFNFQSLKARRSIDPVMLPKFATFLDTLERFYRDFYTQDRLGVTNFKLRKRSLTNTDSEEMMPIRKKPLEDSDKTIDIEMLPTIKEENEEEESLLSEIKSLTRQEEVDDEFLDVISEDEKKVVEQLEFDDAEFFKQDEKTKATIETGGNVVRNDLEQIVVKPLAHKSLLEDNLLKLLPDNKKSKQHQLRDDGSGTTHKQEVSEERKVFGEQTKYLSQYNKVAPTSNLYNNDLIKDYTGTYQNHDFKVNPSVVKTHEPLEENSTSLSIIQKSPSEKIKEKHATNEKVKLMNC